MNLIISLEKYKVKDFSKEKVVLLNTGEVYKNPVDACKKNNISKSTAGHVVSVCRGKEKSIGKINGAPAIWVFYKDYINMSEEDKKKKLRQSNNKPVRCIETGEEFNYLSDASRKYNIDPSCISRVCRGKQKTAGKLTWEFIE